VKKICKGLQLEQDCFPRQCDVGLFCQSAYAGENKCTKKKKNGDYCIKQEECSDSLHCINSKCTAKTGALGASCVKDDNLNSCTGNLFCDDGRCVTNQLLGKHCKLDSNLASETCNLYKPRSELCLNNLCVTEVPCSTDSQCIGSSQFSGYCNCAQRTCMSAFACSLEHSRASLCAEQNCLTDGGYFSLHNSDGCESAKCKNEFLDYYNCWKEHAKEFGVFLETSSSSSNHLFNRQYIVLLTVMMTLLIELMS
jgi:hypothetical protein